MVSGMIQLSDLQPDYKIFNVWQMRNCATCGVPDPCKIRENVLKDLEHTGRLEAPPHCPEKVGGVQ